MPVVKPPSARCTIEALGESLRIVCPSRKHWFQVVFLGVWLVGWMFGETMVGGILLSGLIGRFLGRSPEGFGIDFSALHGVSLFMLVWFVGWTVGGAFALYAFLWQLAGKEIVLLSYSSIQVRRQVLGIGWTKEYLAEHVKNLRVSQMGYSEAGWSRSLIAFGMVGGFIAFDYGAKTFRFGSGIDEAEAKQIVSVIQRCFSRYRNR
jgi:hypothetical protein